MGGAGGGGLLTFPFHHIRKAVRRGGPRLDETGRSRSDKLSAK
jgi:hypothetical protein